MTWIDQALPGTGLPVQKMYATGSVIRAGTYGGSYRSLSIDSGWVRETQSNVTFLAYASTSSYVLAGISDLEGIIWASVTDNVWHFPIPGWVGNNRIDAMAQNTDYIFAGTYAGASDKVWRMSVSLVGINTISSNVPSSYNLFQNYPNPFNPSTKIKFDIAKTSDVTLEIFNELGQKVKVLYSGNLNAGSYSYDFNAENFSSGIYYYELKTSDFTQVKKMALLK